MYHTKTEMCTALLQSGALWDMGPVYRGTRETGPFINDYASRMVARADQGSVKAVCQYRLAMGSIKVATRQL